MQLSLVTLCLSLVPALAGEPAVNWRGKAYSPTALPSALDARARAAVARWTDLARQLELRFDVDSSARFVVLSPDDGKYLEHALPFVDRTFDLCGSRLPTPPPAPAEDEARPGSGAPAGGTKPAPTPLPEDPEEPPAGAPAPKTVAPRAATASAAGPEPATILFLRDPRDYERALQFLARTETYLTKWTRDAEQQSAFTLEKPLCGALVISQPVQEEWNPDNEIVNRCAQLALLQRFGRLPNWAMQGFAWCAEFELQGAVYCFPYRDEFVGIGEHTDWDALLEAAYAGRDAPALRLEDFAKWPRGTWNTQAAHRAWGAIDHLLRTDALKLACFFRDVRAETDAKARLENADGSWYTLTGFELAPADQERLLRRHFGDDVLARMRAAWARGRGK